MAITIVRLGSPRKAKEGLRIGPVRRPPRGVPKSEYAKRDFYDVWLPNLSPSPALIKEAKAAHDKRSWSIFERKFRSEMNALTLERFSIFWPRSPIRLISRSDATAAT